MMAPYLLRLVCLSLAVFFAIHFTTGLLVTLAGRAWLRAARRMSPRPAARLLLALRLLPSVLGLLVVAGICIPSYLLLEPDFSSEEIGASCLAAAMLGASVWTLALIRGLRGLLRASRHTRDCMRLGRPAGLTESRLPIWACSRPRPRCSPWWAFSGPG